jgi:superfamily II DNA or RNA helicase
LDGETPEDERAAILARLELGQTHVVSNYGVLCEGWDQPSCKCVVLARPTKSLVIYMQSAGRTLRPWCPCGCERPATCPRAVAPIILDHGGNVDRHGMPHEDRQWSLDDKPKRPRDAPMKACRECFAYIPSALMVCPHCAYEFPAPTHAEEPAELETLDHVELALRSLTGDDAQLSFWRREAQRARDRRMKPGYVYHRFIERFQTEPPIEWVRSLKRAAKKDADWRVAFDRPDRRVGT